MTLDSHIWAPPVPQLLGSRAKPFAQVETASKTRVEMRPRRDPCAPTRVRCQHENIDTSRSHRKRMYRCELYVTNVEGLGSDGR